MLPKCYNTMLWDVWFPQEVFLNKLLITVKKKQKIELTKEQGWYSGEELVELGWSKPGSHLLSTSLEIYNHEGQCWLVKVLTWLCFFKTITITTDCQGTKSKAPRKSAKPWGRAMPGSGNMSHTIQFMCACLFSFSDILHGCWNLVFPFGKVQPCLNLFTYIFHPGIPQWQEKWIRWRRGVLGHDQGDGKENGIHVIRRTASAGEGGHTLNFQSVHFIGAWWILQVLHSWKVKIYV